MPSAFPGACPWKLGGEGPHFAGAQVCGLMGGVGSWVLGGAGLSWEGPWLSHPGSQTRVGLKQVADLRPTGPGSPADPYARISLSSLAGHRHEMKVVHGTLSPVFSESYCFPVRGAGGGAAHTPVCRSCALSCRCQCWAMGTGPSPSRWVSSACCWALWTCSMSWSAGNNWGHWAPPR